MRIQPINTYYYTKTTYGTFDGIDAYEKSYYPEFENKFENE